MKSADDLLTFLAVARMGSISGAARILKQDPATAGRKVQRLEDELGTILFAKSPRGYRLTEAGLRLQAHAEEMESVLFEIDGSFRQSSSQLLGKFRIGAPDGCATFLLPEVCAKISSEHPGLVMEVVAASKSFDLLDREVDLEISVTKPSQSGVHSTHLADYQLHFAHSRGAWDPEGLPLISYIPELLVDSGLDIPPAYRDRDPVLRSNSVLVQWEWLKAGRGVGLVHDFAFRREPNLVRIYPDFALSRSYYLNMRRDDARFKRMKILADLVTTYIKQDLDQG